MNQSPNRRFKQGLSGLMSLSFFIVGYSISGEINSVNAADTPTAAQTQSSQENFIDIPGAFKDMPGAKDAVTQKRPANEIQLGTGNQSAQLEIDATKGVSVKPSSAGLSPTEEGLQDFHATAYCLKGRTASGEHVRPGVIAADPRVLPLGTVVHLRAGRYTGTYTVLDTGSRIKGRVIDVYVPSYRDAREFGRRPVKIKVLGKPKRSSSNRTRKNATGADL
jgi:3D (Asp-Asp-Asp) domain-containing protein